MSCTGGSWVLNTQVKTNQPFPNVLSIYVCDKDRRGLKKKAVDMGNVTLNIYKMNDFLQYVYW